MKSVSDIISRKKYINKMEKTVSEQLESIREKEKRLDKDLTNEFGIIPTKLNSLRRNVSYINDQELDNLAKDGRQFYEYKMEKLLFDSKKKNIAMKCDFI